MDEQHEVSNALQRIEQDLQRLETEYGKYFNHRRSRPPQELRARVESSFRRWSNVRIKSSADRFRFSTLQARYATYVRLWDTALRAREEGRTGPFSHLIPPDPPSGPRRGPVVERRGPAPESAPETTQGEGDEGSSG
jgi:hypothetical protein